MTLKAFSDGKLSDSNFKIAELYARLELQSIQTTYQQFGWSYATGASGTIKAIAKVLRAQHDNSETASPYPGITLKGLQCLFDACELSVTYLAILLRLSILLHRDRSKNTLPDITIIAENQKNNS